MIPDLYGEVVDDESWASPEDRSGISQRMRASILLARVYGYTENEIALLPQRKINQLLAAAQIDLSKGGGMGCPFMTQR